MPAREPPSRILRVALDTPLRRLFDYLEPTGAPVALAPGMRVSVPFGARTRVGLLIGIGTDSTLPLARLKRVHRVLDAEPVFTADSFALVLDAAAYYQHPPGEAFATALPAGLRDGQPLHRTRTGFQRALAAAGTARLGPRQRAVLEAIDAARVLEEDAPALAGAAARAALRTLIARGLVARIEQAPRPGAPGSANPIPGPTLNAQQHSAVAAIGAALGRFAPFLLHGVTGSGKTEVYLQAIRIALARGLQSLVLVPEIGLTPQLLARFQDRLGVPLAVLHSALTESERLEQWRQARAGHARVVIGTRSAVFVPLPEPGLLIVDEEHDGSYKQQDGLRYSARDLAVWRAQRIGAPVVLGSATPSLETLANARAGRYARLDLPHRTGSAGKPRLAVVDLNGQPMQGALATYSVQAIERHLASGAQVLVFINRRGYAPTLYCPGCGYVVPCPNCDARLTVHGAEQRLKCHHCGALAALPYACPRCTEELKPLGQGTERVEDTLRRLLPGVSVLRIDRDTIRRRGEIDVALAAVRSGAARVLVGTQMLTKGHDFPDVTLVIALDADQGLFGSDFRTSERLAQTIVQVAGRAGRASRPGEVLIQTTCPGHPLLTQLLSSGYDGFANAALEEREHAHWPPYTRLAVIRAEATAAALPMQFLGQAREAAADLAGTTLRVLGPAPPVMARRAGRYRAQLLLEAPSRPVLQRFLARWLPRIEVLALARRVRWSVDVDPIEVV